MPSFHERLTELRIEKKLSQKEAAYDLNISQALLSHYEKGIRECGLDFLCRSAEYYSVTTDYLLGISESRNGLAQNDLGDLDDDTQYSPSTICRALMMSGERISAGGAAAGEQLKNIYTLSVYRSLMAASKSGYIPKKWFTVNTKYADGFALAAIENMLNDFPERTVSVKRKGGSQPLCVQTLISSSEDIIRKSAAAVKD